MYGSCIRCGQVGTLASLATLTIDVGGAATDHNAVAHQKSFTHEIGLCEACTWGIAGSWPSAVGMCAHVREVERRARADRRASYAARTGGRRATDRIVVPPAGKSE